eukprot:jgi/Mesvir1/1005/Mv17542-RA.1
MPIAAEDFLKLSAAVGGAYATQLVAAPKWSNDFYMTAVEPRNDTLMQWVGIGVGCSALGHLAMATTPGDKTNALKATAAVWSLCGAAHAYFGLKEKTMKKDIAVANLALAATFAGLSVAKLNGKI